MSGYAIQTQQLSRKYGDTLAVDQLTLNIKEGEIFGFLGHNGAGKTTTINMLTTLLLPTSGTAQVCGLDIVKDNLAVRQHIGYVPESVRLYNELTVAENLSFFGALSGIQNLEQKVNETLELIGCGGWNNRRVGGFSKGMRQRIGIAQALIHQPEVLFMDEPSSGLDPEATREMMDLIQKLNREQHITIFMNTHQLAEVTKLCTSIAIMSHGRLIMTDTLQSIMAQFPEDHSLEDIYLHVERTQRAGKDN